MKGKSGDGRIGHLVKYANDYQWWNALYPDADENLKGNRDGLGCRWDIREGKRMTQRQQ